MSSQDVRRLVTDHLIINIALPEFDSAGLQTVQRDPRKFRMKPDAFSGVVEEVGPRCTVKVGDRVVVERWQWTQLDLDNERLLARESDLLIISDSTPAPGVTIVQLEREDKDESEKIGLVSAKRFEEKKPYFVGHIIAIGGRLRVDGVELEIGDKVWFERQDYGQFKYGDGRMAFRRRTGCILAYYRSQDPA